MSPATFQLLDFPAASYYLEILVRKAEAGSPSAFAHTSDAIAMAADYVYSNLAANLREENEFLRKNGIANTPIRVLPRTLDRKNKTGTQTGARN